MNQNDNEDIRRKESTLPPADVTLEALRNNRLSPDDVTIRKSELERQASLAEAQGYEQLARNFRRAAELVAVPGDVLLETYDRLRPGRSRYVDLLAMAQEFAARYDAPETSAYIREAAETYRARGLLRE
ncbi:MAG: diol dehydratase small subunit [Hyphomicrobiales bacterium]